MSLWLKPNKGEPRICGGRWRLTPQGGWQFEEGVGPGFWQVRWRKTDVEDALGRRIGPVQWCIGVSINGDRPCPVTLSLLPLFPRHFEHVGSRFVFSVGGHPDIVFAR